MSWLIAAEASFAIMRIAVRHAEPTAHWAQVAALRFLIGGIVILAWAISRGHRLSVHRAGPVWLRCGLGVASAWGTFYALGRSDVSVGDVAAIGTIAPLLVGVASRRFLDESVTLPTAVALTVGCVGTILLVRPAFSTTPLPACAALGGAVLFAGAVLALRSASLTETPHAVALRVSAAAGIAFALLAVFSWRPVSPWGWGSLCVAGMFGGVGQLAMTKGLARISAARGVVIGFLGAAATYGLDALSLARAPAWLEIAGLFAIAVSAIVALVWSRAGPHGSGRTSDVASAEVR